MLHPAFDECSGHAIWKRDFTGAAGLFKNSKLGKVPANAKIVVTVTGHGLKDVGWALKDENGNDISPTSCSNSAAEVAELLGLEKN